MGIGNINKNVLTSLVCAVLLLTVLFTSPVYAVRLKDIASIEGVRDNQLIGFGLVGGLAGTGDDPKNALYTAEAISGMLSQFGFQVQPEAINIKNFAAVAVTADMPAYLKNGDRLDITISSIGSAKSLEGGVLYRTLLYGLDQNAYAVAQGQVSLGDMIGQSGGGRGGKKHSTVGRIVGGAIIEKEIPSSVVSDYGTIKINLHHADFTTAENVCNAIQRLYGINMAMAIDAGTVEIMVPEVYMNDIVPFIASLEGLDIERDNTAKVVINQRTGTVIMGGDIGVLPVAIAHGSLSITVGEDGRIVSNSTDSGTAVTQASGGTESAGSENLKKETILKVTANDIVSGLNALGVAPRDIVAIFEAIEAAGALQGVLEII